MALAAAEADAVRVDVMRIDRRVIGTVAVICALSSDASAQIMASRSHAPVQQPTAPRPDILRSPLPASPHPDTLLSQGRSLYHAGRYKEAAASFERALQAGVKKPHEAAWEVARAYAKLGNDKQARRWQRIAVQLADGGGRLGGDAARALPSSMAAPPAWRARLTQRRQSSGERDREEHRPGSAAREEAR